MKAIKGLGQALLFVGLILAGIFLCVGCSTYGHYEEPAGPGGIDRVPPPEDDFGDDAGEGYDPRKGSGKCDADTTCCNPSSCEIPCKDGFVCMTGRCYSVLRLIGKSK